MDFDGLYHPTEGLDQSLAGLLDGAGILVVLGLAVLLGLRHASDPDHLVSVTSLLAAEDASGARRLGIWWGVGHAATLLMVGMPMIAFGSEIPSWLAAGAERAVGVVIIVLAGRLLYTWWRGRQERVRSTRQAFLIGVLHGLAGTGAVVLVLAAAVPTQIEVAAALAVFAPMSVLSMTACTSAFAWVLTQPAVEPIYRGVLIPALGAFGMIFGLWYAGIVA